MPEELQQYDVEDYSDDSLADPNYIIPTKARNINFEDGEETHTDNSETVAKNPRQKGKKRVLTEAGEIVEEVPEGSADHTKTKRKKKITEEFR